MYDLESQTPDKATCLVALISMQLFACQFENAKEIKSKEFKKIRKVTKHFLKGFYSLLNYGPK